MELQRPKMSRWIWGNVFFAPNNTTIHDACEVVDCVCVFVFKDLLKSFHQSGFEENFVDWRKRGGRKPCLPDFSSPTFPLPPIFFPPIFSPPTSSTPSSSRFFLFLRPTLTSNSLPRRTGIVASIVAAKVATWRQVIQIKRQMERQMARKMERSPRLICNFYHHFVLQVAIVIQQVRQVEKVHRSGSHVVI